MLLEYALDPNVLTNWDSFRYFIENFGVSKGRMISKYPKKTWKLMVAESCKKLCRPVEFLKIVDYLENMDDKFFQTQCKFDPSVSWFLNAEANRSSFHAVISNEKSNNENVIVADEIQYDTPLWDIPREKPVKRTARELANCAGRLLEHAREILFIDPHFDPTKPRYQNTLKAFLEKVPEPGKLKRIEYHLSNKWLPSNFSGQLKEYLPRILSRGVTITFIRWLEADNGDSIHPRYILTDRGGIRIEHGLDEEPGGPTADVSLLDISLFKSRWDDYQKNPTAYFDASKAKPTFKYVDECVVTGTR